VLLLVAESVASHSGGNQEFPSVLLGGLPKKGRLAGYLGTEVGQAEFVTPECRGRW
jgi:hypothetical protein